MSDEKKVVSPEVTELVSLIKEMKVKAEASTSTKKKLRLYGTVDELETTLAEKLTPELLKTDVETGEILMDLPIKYHTHYSAKAGILVGEKVTASHTICSKRSFRSLPEFEGKTLDVVGVFNYTLTDK